MFRHILRMLVNIYQKWPEPWESIWNNVQFPSYWSCLRRKFLWMFGELLLDGKQCTDMPMPLHHSTDPWDFYHHEPVWIGYLLDQQSSLANWSYQPLWRFLWKLQLRHGLNCSWFVDFGILQLKFWNWGQILSYSILIKLRRQQWLTSKCVERCWTSSGTNDGR